MTFCRHLNDTSTEFQDQLSISLSRKTLHLELSLVVRYTLVPHTDCLLRYLTETCHLLGLHSVEQGGKVMNCEREIWSKTVANYWKVIPPPSARRHREKSRKYIAAATLACSVR